MHNSFLVFDFGANEEAAQQARHKLEGWKQAFRLDKKLLYKFDRQEQAAPSGNSGSAKEEAARAKPTKAGKAKSGKAASSSESAKSKDQPETKPDPKSAADIKLLVRLYFSGHERLSYQRWVDRIPTEEPFKSVRHELINSVDARYSDFDQRFESLD